MVGINFGGFMGFYAYCESLGVGLLREDKVFIKSCLRRIDKSDHKIVLSRYVELWVQMLGELGDAVQAQNVGRRTANAWLRDYR